MHAKVLIHQNSNPSKFEAVCLALQLQIEQDNIATSYPYIVLIETIGFRHINTPPVKPHV